MIHLIIVEDNPTAGKLLLDYIEGEEIHVHAIYTSGEEALKKIPTLPLPDVMLMDIGLPGISGIELTRRLKQRYPTIEIVVQTVYDDTDNIVEAIRAGASGYLLKASSREEIIHAILEAQRGGSFLTPKVARQLLCEFQQIGKAAVRPERFSASGLTEREEQILKRLVEGDAYKTIATQFRLSIHTVNTHIRKIYEKLQVHSRGEAVAKIAANAAPP
jgi:DNA-binding NarL/FixJ family response regulator